MKKIVISTSCPLCRLKANAPLRAYGEDGKVILGCVDHFHTGHLITPNESSRWHNRPVAKGLRTLLKASRDGYVTEAA